LLGPLALACLCASAGCDESSDPAGSDASARSDAGGHAGERDAGASAADAGDSGASDPGGSDAAVAQDGGSDGAGKGHLIVVTERESPETSMQYLHVLEAWPEDDKVDYAKAVELGEFVSVHALGNAVFVHQPEEATVRKLIVGANGDVAEDVTVSFAAQGALGVAGDMIYVSETRAYLLDETSGQFVVWNPSTMEVLGSFDLDKDVLTRDGLAAQISRGVALGGEGFVSMSWRDWETLDYYDSAAIGVFDATSLEPKLRVLEDDRCASTVATPFDGGDGFVYLVSDAALGFDAIANPMRTQKKLCVLRMRPGSGELDKDFFVDIKEVLGTPGFYAAHPMKSGKLLVNMWAPDVEVSSVAKGDDSNWYWEYPAYFEYAIVDLAKGTSIPVKELTRAAVQFSSTLGVDGETYVQTYRDDMGSDLQRVDLDGSITRVLSNGPATDVQYLGRVSQ
jgi:hypothetical protein